MHVGATVVKLIILSLVIGFVLHFFGVTPDNVYQVFGQTVTDVYRWLIQNVESLVPYIVTGAAIVVPVWAVFAVLRLLKGRREP